MALDVRPTGFEPATAGFEVRNSIQMSYGRIAYNRSKNEWVPSGIWTHDNQIHNLALYPWTIGTVQLMFDNITKKELFSQYFRFFFIYVFFSFFYKVNFLNSDKETRVKILF